MRASYVCTRVRVRVCACVFVFVCVFMYHIDSRMVEFPLKEEDACVKKGVRIRKKKCFFFSGVIIKVESVAMIVIIKVESVAMIVIIKVESVAMIPRRRAIKTSRRRQLNFELGEQEERRGTWAVDRGRHERTPRRASQEAQRN